LGLTVFAEFFCALALALGLLTRAAVIPLIVTMLTAAFVILGDDPFGKKELALLYLVPFVTILIVGPGRFSLDRLLSGQKTYQTS
jgi:putative oxidoreductase